MSKKNQYKFIYIYAFPSSIHSKGLEVVTPQGKDLERLATRLADLLKANLSNFISFGYFFNLLDSFLSLFYF